MTQAKEPRFSRNALKTIDEATSTYKGRGDQYGDTWEECQWLVVIAAARKIGYNLTKEEARLLGGAALCDVKYARFLGGYDPDHCLDGINYLANFKAEMDNFDEQRHKRGG